MSNESPTESTSEPAPAKPRWYRRWIPKTVAARAALVTALVLLVTLGIVWAVRRLGPQSVSHTHAISWTRMAIEFLLVLMIPAVLYAGLRRWNQVIEGLYPDVDQAWQAGVAALEAQGIDLSEHPLFLILGSSDETLEEGLAGALESNLTIRGVPKEAGIHHALQWYATSEAVYLFCPGASALSALTGRWIAPPVAAPVRAAVPPARPAEGEARASVSAAGAAPSPTRTGQGKSPPAGDSATAASGQSSSGGAAADRPASAGGPGQRSSDASPTPPPPPASEPAYLGTIQLQSIPSSPEAASPSAPAEGTPARSISHGMAGDAESGTGVPPIGRSSGQRSPVPPRPLGTITQFDASPPGSDPDQSTAGSPTRSSHPQPPQSQSPHPQSTTRRPLPEVRPPNTSPPSAAAGDRNPTASSVAAQPSVAAQRLAAGRLALPASLDTSDALPRLRYLCNLLYRSRRPRCGLNGIVTLIPFELSRAGPLQLSALSQSARGDVDVIQETLGVRAPVTAMLVGLEQDKGFAELVRRLQPELLSRRLGGRFDLRSRPTPEELNSHSDRLCDAFEDWVYRLFSHDDALAQQRGNRKLYALISRIRHELKPRLRITLGQAFGCKPNEADQPVDDDDQSFFFSGCYFGATGALTGQPAFVRGVLRDKLLEEQSKVQWTEQMRRRQRRFRALVILGWIVAVILGVALLVIMLRNR